MKIDLSKEMSDHFNRLKTVAEEAETSEDESLSARASALSAMTALIKELVKTQAEITNMAALQELQSAIVEALEEYDQELKDKVVEILERRLETIG